MFGITRRRVKRTLLGGIVGTCAGSYIGIAGFGGAISGMWVGAPIGLYLAWKWTKPKKKLPANYSAQATDATAAPPPAHIQK